MRRISVTLISIIVVITICLMIYLKLAVKPNNWKERTNPLPMETIDLLCLNFDLSPKNYLCNGRDEVYALDFYSVIQDELQQRDTIETESSENATYDDVEEKIGSFRYECEPVVHQADGFSYFRCFYDLHGDREFVMAIYYSYPEMVIVRIAGTSRFDE